MIDDQRPPTDAALRFRQDLRFRLPYLIACALWVAVLGYSLIHLGKAGSFLLINHRRSSLADTLFPVFTFIGNGLFVVPFCALLYLVRRRRAAWLVLLSYGVSGLWSQVLKFGFDAPRPYAWFSDKAQVLTAPGIHLFVAHSFPSGHSGTIFAAATVLVLAARKKGLSLLLFAIACLTAYSRVYLGEHFVSDIAVGSALGVLSGLISYALWLYYLEAWCTEKKLLC